MGHGDEIVIADGNFPSVTCAQRLVRSDGHGAAPILEAILDLFPLDDYVDNPVVMMSVVPGDSTPTPPIWETFNRILQDHGQKPNKVEFVDRDGFYKRSKEAFAVVATGESALYANIILKKGVLK